MSNIIHLHEKAKKRAQTKDRKWFNCHWGRCFRARGVLPFEIEGPVETYPGLQRQMIVAQICPGRRMRLLVPIIYFDGDGNQVDFATAGDDVLLDMFERCATTELLAEYRSERAKFAPEQGGAKW